MTEENIMPHSVILNERKELRVSGVTDVDSFNEESIAAYTGLGALIISGEELHISRLDVETGELSVEGNVSSLAYEVNHTKGKSFLSRLLK